MRAGWTYKIWDYGGEAWRRDCPERREYKYHPSHPFPATIDGAASAMPPGWDWSKDDDGWQTWEKGSMMQNLGLDDTGDEIHDRYLLAKLAWEAMEAAK